MTRDAPPRHRKACQYEVYIPDPLAGQDFTISAHAAGFVAEADAAIRNLNAHARPALQPLARLLLREESIASSKVEGMQMGARELARAEARMEAGEKPGPTALEILANIEAMAIAIDKAAETDSISISDILDVHTSLMAKTPAAHIAGRLRTVQNWIGGNDYTPCGADFVPPPPEHVEPLLEDLCAAIEDDALPPLVQAALVHAQFETIHPFDDGNGRTGRALIHIVLRRRGVAPEYVPPISIALSRARDRYIRGLIDFREDRLDAWIEHFAGAAATAARLGTAYLESVVDLTEKWRQKLHEMPDAPRADAVAWKIIDELPAHPMITASIAAAATRKSKPQVNAALQTLETAGVIKLITSGKRNRTWEADGLLDLIAEMER